MQYLYWETKCTYIFLFPWETFELVISMASWITAVTPLLTHWSYCSLALRRWYLPSCAKATLSKSMADKCISILPFQKNLLFQWLYNLMLMIFLLDCKNSYYGFKQTALRFSDSLKCFFLNKHHFFKHLRSVMCNILKNLLTLMKIN